MIKHFIMILNSIYILKKLSTIRDLMVFMQITLFTGIREIIVILG